MSHGTPPPQEPYGQAPPPGPSQPSGKGFFGALFDFSFQHFVTPMLVKVVYILATVALVVGWLFWLVAGFTQDAAFGIGVLVLGPVVLLIYLALVRMTLEFYLSVVRMSEDIHHRLPRG
jgi:hypothetical protein